MYTHSLKQSISSVPNSPEGASPPPRRKRKTSPLTEDRTSELLRDKRGKFAKGIKGEKRAAVVEAAHSPSEVEEAQEAPEALEELKSPVVAMTSLPSTRTRSSRAPSVRAAKQPSVTLASRSAAISSNPEPVLPHAPSKRKRAATQARKHTTISRSRTQVPTSDPRRADEEQDKHQSGPTPSIRPTRPLAGKRKLWSQKLDGLPPSGWAKAVPEATTTIQSPDERTVSITSFIPWLTAVQHLSHHHTSRDRVTYVDIGFCSTGELSYVAQL